MQKYITLNWFNKISSNLILNCFELAFHLKMNNQFFNIGNIFFFKLLTYSPCSNTLAGPYIAQKLGYLFWLLPIVHLFLGYLLKRVIMKWLLYNIICSKENSWNEHTLLLCEQVILNNVTLYILATKSSCFDGELSSVGRKVTPVKAIWKNKEGTL